MVGPQFFRFLVTGGIAAAANIGSRYVFNLFMSFELAVVAGYLVGMAIAYVLARLFVFEASGRSVSSEFGRFATVNLFALAFVWGISVGLAFIVFPAIRFTWHAEDVAHFIGVLAPAATSFLGHRHYSFRGRSSAT
jgi:putative flippase GtrA